MSGLQTILNFCSSIDINRRNVVGIQFTRNEQPRTSLTPTFNPWKFTLEMPSSFRYSESRDLMEALDTLDRYTPQVITFSDLPQLSWIFKYRGRMTTAQINAITVVSYVGNVLTLTGLPAVAASTVLFAPNDLIQIGNNTYPFTSETTVTRGTGANVVVTTSRPNIISGSVVGDGITVGNSCDFYMFCPNMPTYKLIPGGATKGPGNVTTNNALLEFTDSFELYEWVGTT
jgi:hypothetical protein